MHNSPPDLAAAIEDEAAGVNPQTVERLVAATRRATVRKFMVGLCWLTSWWRRFGRFTHYFTLHHDVTAVNYPSGIRSLGIWLQVATRKCQSPRGAAVVYPHEEGQRIQIKMLMDLFRGGGISKEILTVTLRAYQTAVNATKSPHRKAAEEYFKGRWGCWWDIIWVQ